MAILGNIVFWLAILFCIIAVSFKAGKDTGIEQEKQNHNMQFTIDQRKCYEAQQKAKSKAQWWQVKWQ